MDLQAPTWMNIEFFAQLLYHFRRKPITDMENVKLTVLNGNKKSKVGVWGAEVTYSNRGKMDQFSVFFKFSTDKIHRCPYFNVELNVYTKVLPELERVLGQAGYNHKFSPRHHILDSCISLPILILDDLKSTEKAKQCDRLDLTGMQELFKVIAKFHAASWYLHHENRISFHTYNRGILTTTRDFNFFMDNVERLVDTSKDWSDFPAFKNHIANLPILYQRARDHLYGKSAGCFKVLNHGELSPKNVFVNYTADKNLQDIQFIDFKSCVWSSPCLDLMFAFYLLAQPDVLTHKAGLIKFYYDEFARTVQELGCLKPLPSLLDLNIDFNRHGFIEILLALSYLPYQMQRENPTVKDPFHNEEYLALLHQQMKYFLFKGIFKEFLK